QWEKEDLVKALGDCDLTPQSDPNTPSHTIRVMKAVALVQLVMMAPNIWDLVKVAQRVTAMVGVGDIDDLLAPPQQGQPGVDPKHMTDLMKIQAQMAGLAQKEQDSQRKAAMGHIAEQMSFLRERMNMDNAALERMSRERVEQIKGQAQMATARANNQAAIVQKHIDTQGSLLETHAKNQASLEQTQAKNDAAMAQSDAKNAASLEQARVKSGGRII